MVKVCSICKQEKPAEDFYKGSGRGGLDSRCKVCHAAKSREYQKRNASKVRERQKRWYRQHPEKKVAQTRRAKLKKLYGMTDADYMRRYAFQVGRCAICGKYVEYPRLFVDHNHETGKVRGLLCLQCNTLLGHAHDDTTILARAITYLNSFE